MLVQGRSLIGPGSQRRVRFRSARGDGTEARLVCTRKIEDRERYILFRWACRTRRFYHTGEEVPSEPIE